MESILFLIPKYAREVASERNCVDGKEEMNYNKTEHMF